MDGVNCTFFRTENYCLFPINHTLVVSENSYTRVSRYTVLFD